MLWLDSLFDEMKIIHQRSHIFMLSLSFQLFLVADQIGCVCI